MTFVVRHQVVEDVSKVAAAGRKQIPYMADLEGAVHRSVRDVKHVDRLRDEAVADHPVEREVQREGLPRRVRLGAAERLQILRDLTPRLHGRPGGDGGAAAVLPAVTLALTSDEAAVRSAAVETAAACYRRLGRARVESVLLEDEGLKPALRQVLGMTFRGIDTEGVAR